MSVAGILLAAGAATRMRGEDKLLREIDGEPLLSRSARALCGSEATPVIVVLGHAAENRRAALANLPVISIIARDWAEGMAASMRAGLNALPGSSAGALIALADMPLMSAAHVDQLIAAFDPVKASIVRATDPDGRPGNPVIFARTFFDALCQTTGDEGGRSVLAANRSDINHVQLPGKTASLDLDTPEAWTEWSRR